MGDTLESINTCERIFSNGVDVLIRGKAFWQFRADGEFVRRIPIRHPNRVSFLPERTIFIDGVQKYYYLSLVTGEALWVLEKERSNRIDESRSFVVSLDGRTVYSSFYRNERGKRVFYIEVFCLDGHQYQVLPIAEGLALTASLFVDDNGVLCALQRQYIPSTQEEDVDFHSLHLHGILAIPFQDGLPCPYWKQQWEITDSSPYCFGRACDGKYILFDDYSVLNLETRQIFFLLDEAERETIPTGGFESTYDAMRSLLTLQYVSTMMPFDRQKVIIDCRNRKIAARYLMEEPQDREELLRYSVGYRGCLVGDSFWIGTTTDGVARLPFPNSSPPIKRSTPEEEYAAMNASWWRFVRETRKYRKPE